MKTEFRPIPLTILDFLGVLLPGCVWLLLLCASVDLITTGTANPVSAWQRVVSMQKEGGTWLGPLAVMFAALIIGYSLKPLAMEIAQQFSKYFHKITSRTSSYHPKDMIFPFNEFFSSEQYHSNVGEILKKVCALDSTDDLPGKAPFSPAKRYLRLISPALWEESERMEAEVRMIGGFFLASIYSCILSSLIVITDSVVSQQMPHLKEWIWIFSTFAITFMLGICFNRTRLHEVEYTYMNLLLSEGHRIQSKASCSDNINPKSENGAQSVFTGQRIRF